VPAQVAFARPIPAQIVFAGPIPARIAFTGPIPDQIPAQIVFTGPVPAQIVLAGPIPAQGAFAASALVEPAEQATIGVKPGPAPSTFTQEGGKRTARWTPLNRTRPLHQG
jgi:hypothetical protein